MSSNPTKRVLVLMSDTGGGHRAAAEAIQAAAEERYGGALTFDLVDVFRHYTPPPFRYAPEIYPRWVNRAAVTWKLSYHSINSPRRSALAVRMLSLLWQRGIQRLIADHPADMILGVHSLVSRPVLSAFRRLPNPPPALIVVTDLVTTHASWYDPAIERCLVPTQAAFQYGLTCGLAPEQMRVVGLPVHPDFARRLTRKDAAREALGLHPELPAVLLVAGGEGMGQLFETAAAINDKQLPCQLMIVAGRNEALQAQLQAHAWNQPTQIYGFVNFMPRLMAAADMLVTKAGPATISEAFLAGLPIILNGAVPGQEDGNITLVVENGAGVYAPSPSQTAQTVEAWLATAGEIEKRAAHAKKLAQPDAVWQIADEIYQMAYSSEPITALPASPQ